MSNILIIGLLLIILCFVSYSSFNAISNICLIIGSICITVWLMKTILDITQIIMDKLFGDD